MAAGIAGGGHGYLLLDKFKLLNFSDSLPQYGYAWTVHDLDELLDFDEIIDSARRNHKWSCRDPLPINISQECLDMTKLLKMTELRNNMNLIQFRSAMKLDLNKNLSRI